MRTKNLILFLLLLVFFTFCGCKKINEQLHETSVHGIVADDNTGKPIAGAIISVFSFDPDIVNSGKNIWFTITGNDGHYEYRFHAKNKMNYTITGYKVVDCYNFHTALLKLGQVNELNMFAGSSAQIKFHIKNINPFDDNDNICKYYLGSVFCLDGSNVDYTSPEANYIYHGNTKIEIRWEVTKNGIISNYSDSIFIKPCVVNDFYINY